MPISPLFSPEINCISWLLKGIISQNLALTTGNDIIIVIMDWVGNIRENQRFEGVVVIKSVTARSTRDGRPFLDFKLADKTGEVTAMWWDPPNANPEDFPIWSVVLARGVVRMYQGRPELQLEALLPQAEFDVERFVERAEKPFETAMEECRQWVKQVKNPKLRELLHRVLQAEEWRTAPAAKSFHHSVIGGLAEHVSTLLSFVPAVMRIYPMLDQDIFIAGLILHDVGKLFEMSIEAKIEFTSEGKLLGHIAQGLLFFEEKCNEIPDFPKDVKMKLQHIILSHHGSLEFGSPVVPKTLESIVVHYLDDLDAKVWAFWHHIQQSPAEQGFWRGFHREMKREIYFDGNRGGEDESG